ncbi:MAG: carboxylating nicotinate-nucleotide diphosphorylase [Planctomycetota bacterium]
MSIDLNTRTLPELYHDLAQTGLPRRLLQLAHDEDLGPESRDITAELVADASRSVATIRARQPATVAGIACLPDLLDVFRVSLEASVLAADGERVDRGEAVASLTGRLADLVRVERTLLNLLGRLSGIATRTHEFAARIPESCSLLDTRKTTPGLRTLEKYAVRCGGGRLHRIGLNDAVLIKDNHIAHMEDTELTAFIERASAHGRAADAAFVEIEVDTLDQLGAVLATPPEAVDFILLDNMTNEQLRTAVRMRNAANHRAKLEASGGITLETIAAVAETGVERVSVGSLTHQARSIDFGLDIDAA